MDGQNANIISETELHRTKNRIASIDITRLMCAFFVMFEHLIICSNSFTQTMHFGLTMFIPRASPIFFLLAGYFVSRGITWKKAAYNAWWSFAPYVLWCTVAYAVAVLTDPSAITGRSICSLYGIGGLSECGEGVETNFFCSKLPLNQPLWFMRNLIFLFLLSPIICKYIRIIFPIVLVMIVIPSTLPLFDHNAQSILSLSSIAFFSLGCYIRSWPKESQQFCLRNYSPVYVVAYLSIVSVLIALTVFCGIDCSTQSISFIHSLASLVFVYQVSRFLDIRCAIIRKFALKFAPVTFLTFATHYIIYRFCMPAACAEHPMILIFFPAVCFLVCSVLFFSLKRWCRPILHLVAHYKLRPDD